MKRLCGFTLPDVIVTMIISLIITGTAFSVFRYTYNQLLSFQKESEKYEDLYTLYFAIRNDVKEAESIGIKDNTIELTSFFGKDKAYHFLDNKIIRETMSVSDTFPFTTRDFKASYLSQTQIYGKVDEFNFSIEFKKKQFPFKFTKQYPFEIE